jgi:hypothetical protein
MAVGVRVGGKGVAVGGKDVVVGGRGVAVGGKGVAVAAGAGVWTGEQAPNSTIAKTR